MDYRTHRDFYVEMGSRIHFDRFERMLLSYYFLDSRKKKREFSPQLNDETLYSWADRLIEEGQTRLPKDQLFRALQRAKVNAFAELRERIEIYQSDRSNNVMTADRSLAISKLDISLVRTLRENGYRTATTVQRALDEQILAIKGIDRRKLAQIRRFYPHRVTPTPKPAQLVMDI